MRSESVGDVGFYFAFLGWNLARHLPAGPVRFIGYLLATPTILITVFLSFPFLIVLTILSMWETANDE